MADNSDPTYFERYAELLGKFEDHEMSLKEAIAKFVGDQLRLAMSSPEMFNGPRWSFEKLAAALAEYKMETGESTIRRAAAGGDLTQTRLSAMANLLDVGMEYFSPNLTNYIIIHWLLDAERDEALYFMQRELIVQANKLSSTDIDSLLGLVKELTEYSQQISQDPDDSSVPIPSTGNEISPEQYAVMRLMIHPDHQLEMHKVRELLVKANGIQNNSDLHIVLIQARSLAGLRSAKQESSRDLGYKR